MDIVRSSGRSWIPYRGRVLGWRRRRKTAAALPSGPGAHATAVGHFPTVSRAGNPTAPSPHGESRLGGGFRWMHELGWGRLDEEDDIADGITDEPPGFENAWRRGRES